jgi:hypothetical protein
MSRGGLIGLVAVAASLATAPEASAALDFAPGVSYPTAAGIDNVEALDADRDSDRDVVANADDELVLWFNQGAGTLGQATAIGGPVDPGNGLAVGRFNGGPARDIAVVDDRSDPAKVAILISRGDGTFGKPKRYQAGGGPSQLGVGDFDDDGEADIAASSSVQERLSVLYGRGDGSFSRGRRVAVDDTTQELATGDLNRDGRDDIAAVNAFDDLSVAYGQRDRSLRVGPDLEAGTDPFAPEIADFDDDSRRDIAVANSSIPADAEYVAILWGKRKGFAPFASFTAGEVSAVQSVAAGDLSGDGIPDVAAGAYGGSVVALENLGSRSFAPPVPFPIDGDMGPDGMQDVEVVRLDANNSPDLVTANDIDSTLSVLINEVP